MIIFSIGVIFCLYIMFLPESKENKEYLRKQKELEIEVIAGNLLIKNSRYVNLVDVQRIEEIIIKITSFY